MLESPCVSFSHQGCECFAFTFDEIPNLSWGVCKVLQNMLGNSRMILVNKKMVDFCLFYFSSIPVGFFGGEAPKNWKVYQALGSPKTKLCPLVVGNPLYESS